MAAVVRCCMERGFVIKIRHKKAFEVGFLALTMLTDAFGTHS